jgi:hypothetical protein
MAENGEQRSSIRGFQRREVGDVFSAQSHQLIFALSTRFVILASATSGAIFCS